MRSDCELSSRKKGIPVPDQYEIRPFDHSERELEASSAFLRAIFPHAAHLTQAYLRWHYAENPEGRALGYNAYFGGAMVGHSSGQPLSALVEGRLERGVLLLNTAIHPAHRGRGITKRITPPMFKDAAADGCTFVLGIGNKHSTPALLTQFQMIGPMRARIGFGLPRRRAVPVAASFKRVWSEAELRWRLSNPERRYDVEASLGRVSIAGPSGWPGIDALIYDGDNEWGLQARKGGRNGRVRTWVGLDPQLDWSRSFFLPISRRLMPSPLNITYLDLTGKGVRPDYDRFVFRAIDFDPF